MKAEALRQAELEKQRQKALEMERARERAIQQAALQREAEMKELERKRKEEWVKRRQLELEEELRHEKGLVISLKQYQQEMIQQLTQSELEKRTIGVRLNQEKEKYNILIKTIEELKEKRSQENTTLLQKAAEVKVNNNKC